MKKIVVFYAHTRNAHLQSKNKPPHKKDKSGYGHFLMRDKTHKRGLTAVFLFSGVFYKPLSHIFATQRREAPAAAQLKGMRADIPPVELQKSVLWIYQALDVSEAKFYC